MDITKQFKLEHFEKCIAKISSLLFDEHITIEEFDSYAETDDRQVGKRVPQNVEWKPFTKTDRWIAHNNYLWLKKSVTIPKNWAKKQAAFQVSAVCYNVERFESKWMGFEGLLFVDGVPYKGISEWHPIVYLPEHCAGKTVELAMRIWSGTDPQSYDSPYAVEFKETKVGAVDQSALEFSLLSKAALQTLRQLPETNPYHPALFNALQDSFYLVDFTKPESAECRASFQTAFNFLDAKTNEIRKNHYHCATDYIVGHTHLDVAWLWQLHQLTEKTVRTWLTGLRSMEMDSTFTFLQTQPQLYADIKKHYPDVYEQIKKRIKEGRWSAEGSMWVEADCNVSSGEALSRQLLYGKRFFREEFGIETKTLWLPDVFGYSYALPQILKLTEVTTFITSKISWNQYNRFPHDLFYWRGMDGTDILTAFIVIPEPRPRTNWYYTYNGVLTAEVITDAWEAFTEKDLCSSFVHPYGYGDGGGGPTFEQVKIKKYLQKMPGIPNIKDTTLAEFNTELHREIDAKTQKVPVYSGELYLEYHRGTYTSQALIKKNNRTFEFALAHLENLHAFSAVFAKNVCNKDSLRSYWHTLLKNQFHDILPGSSIHSVYTDSAAEFAELGRLVEQDTARVCDALFTAAKNRLTLFNPLINERKDVLKLTGLDTNTLILPDGSEIIGQTVGAEQWFSGLTVPPAGWITLIKGNFRQEELKSPFTITDSAAVTPFVTLRWNKTGHITSLVLNKTGQELVSDGKAMNVFELLEDKPRKYDAWEFEPYAEEKTQIVSEFAGVKTISCGHVAAVLKFTWTYHESIISQNLILYADSPRIDFQTHVMWNEREKILRTAFHTAVVTNKATYDIQYGNVERPTHRNTSWDVARFEVVAHRWADIAERGYGISLLNDCKYGYSALHNCLRLTLLKGSNSPDCTADKGEHHFTYSLLPHSGNWLEAGTNDHAAELNQNVLVFDEFVLNSRTCGSLLTVEGSFVHLDALKLAEDSDDLIVRLHEYGGVRSTLKLTTGFPISSWQKVNILERPLESPHKGSEIELPLAPYEIVTLKLTRKE